MLISTSRKYIIKAQDIYFIEKQLEDLSPTCIMRDKLLTRTVFKIDENESRWLRIRTGDVDCSHNPITSASLIEKTSETGQQQPTRKSISLQLTDYYDSVAFFKSIGLTAISEQETKRTKYTCFYDGIKYTVCFDVWPGIEQYIFASITPATNAEMEDLESFVDHTKILNYAITNLPTDINEVYLKEKGKSASEYSELRF